ncbi:MAG: cell wall hydrolase [Ruminococcus sp.]|nr:cell wall hydrolase [Ruminococcus sp.]
MAYSVRELFARLIQCEAEGEGDEGMRAVASVVMNRVNVPNGEFARISNGGDVRAIIMQKGQFACTKTVNNFQNIYKMNPSSIHYEIADWALAGNTSSSVGNSLFFFNPFSNDCPNFFPSKIGIIYNKIGKHCFYAPTAAYKDT